MSFRSIRQAQSAAEPMFSDRALLRLLIPLIVEQVLTSLMGIADTMMVSNVGSAAVSGVSCVDTINKLIIFLLTALAAGGSIICAQYLGRRDRENAAVAARQVLLGSLWSGLAVMGLCLWLRKPLLRLIFGSVAPDVMEAAEIYFLLTAFSYPFLALQGAAAAIYRAAGNSRTPMLVSVVCNGVNIAGNALLMFVFPFGVAGAAIATTVSIVLAAVWLLLLLRRPGQGIDTGPYTRMRPDLGMLWLVLRIGVPSGVENSMFQLGKLVVQSTVSTLGTTAIASNAIVVVLEFLSSMPSQAIGIGLMTVAGHCVGAGRPEQARYYIKKLTAWGALVLLVFNWLVFAMTGPVAALSGMEAAAYAETVSVMLIISIVKPFLWPISFIPVNGMRAAGDVKFSMFVSVASMWIFRVGLTTVLCRFLGVGLTGIWCGYFADWAVRTLVFSLRYRSGRWAEHEVIKKTVNEITR